MPPFTFGIGSKCLGVVEKDSLELAKTFINCSDPEGWIIEFDFTCSPICSGNKAHTFINFGDFTSAYDFVPHLENFFDVKVRNDDDNVLRINGYYFRSAILTALLKTPFVNNEY
jgi:hypothetical protein